MYKYQVLQAKKYGTMESHNNKKAGKAKKKAVSSSAFCAGQNNIQVFYTFQTINMDGWPAFFIPNEG